VSDFNTPDAEQAEDLTVRTGSAVVSSKADSSMTVFILGAVALATVFLAVLVSTLCRRRLRALFGFKNSNPNAAAPLREHGLEDSVPDVTQHDLDVDRKFKSDRQDDEESPRDTQGTESTHAAPSDELQAQAIDMDEADQKPDVRADQAPQSARIEVMKV